MSVLRVVLGGGLLLGATLALGQETATREAPALAVIVNPNNPVTDLSVSQLRAYLKMERQFWPNGRRCEIFLRPSDTLETRILLDKIYKLPKDALDKYWDGKLYRGDIPSKPIPVPSAAAAASRVRESEGGISIVLANEIPSGVRVLTIGHAKPGDPKYPLVGEIAR